MNFLYLQKSNENKKLTEKEANTIINQYKKSLFGEGADEPDDNEKVPEKVAEVMETAESQV